MINIKYRYWPDWLIYSNVLHSTLIYLKFNHNYLIDINFSRILVDLKIKQSNHNFLYIFQMLSKIKWRRPGCFNQWKRRFNSHSWSSSEFHPSFKWTSFRATHPCRPTGKKLYHNQMLNYKNLTTNLVYRYTCNSNNTTIMIIIIHVDSLIHSC